MRGRLFLHACMYMLACVAVAACSRGFAIRAEGDLQNVTFYFATSADPGQAQEFEITDFEVQRKTGTDTWSAIWTLRGEQKLSAIEYADSYRGLKAAAPAEPLRNNVQYRALASANTSGAKGYASVQFYFDDAGKLIASVMPSR